MFKQLQDAAVKSWRTTVAGILAFLAVASVQFGTLLDNDPGTNPDWSLLVASLTTLIGLLFARDNGVKSEQAVTPDK